MSILDGIDQEQGQEQEKNINDLADGENIISESAAERPTLIQRLFRLSPNKGLEEYTNHPLNYDQKQSTSRIIRGATGILDDLNYALFDVAFGLLEKFKETKVNSQVKQNVDN